MLQLMLVVLLGGGGSGWWWRPLESGGGCGVAEAFLVPATAPAPMPTATMAPTHRCGYPSPGACGNVIVSWLYTAD